MGIYLTFLMLVLPACVGNKAPPESAGAGMGPSGASRSKHPSAISGVNAGGTLTTETSQAGDMQLFLLFGQSNMEGAPQPAADDLVENPRVRVLGYDTFGERKWNEWATARPPLHRAWAGVGPGDYFGKAMAEAWPDKTIGLIPCAISGVDIDYFRKGVVSSRRSEFEIPPDNTRKGAYEMVIERVQLAQQQGIVRGMLFHQGESDSGQPAWLDKVQELVADLRSDLGLSDSVPFVAGELLYSGCCSGHNSLVNQLPSMIRNAHVVSARDLTELSDPYNAHFDLLAQRELGRRYAEVMLRALESE